MNATRLDKIGLTPATPPTLALSSIVVSRNSNLSLAVDSTQQFTATGIYLDGLTADITSQVFWTSSNPMIATISSTGLASGVSVGTTYIMHDQARIYSPLVILTEAVSAIPPSQPREGTRQHSSRERYSC